MNVKAKDKGTGKEQKITITGSSGLSKDEVEKMAKEAEIHADDDKKKKDLAEARNIAESLIYSTEKVIKENKDKVDSAVQKDIEEKIKELQEKLKTDNADEIKAKTDELSMLAQKIGEQIYKQASDKKEEKGGEDESEEKKKTVEGEYEEGK